MDIVGEMADPALARQLDLFGSGRHMTGDAIDALVGPMQGEVGLGIVVEVPDRPTVRIVAAGTGLGQALFVLVIRPMAGSTIGFGVRIGMRRMAFLAGDGGVEAQQWEVRQIVVESNRLGPGVLIVAYRARLALLAAVHIVGLVTPQAILLDGIFEFPRMATLT